ncbi:hypothetical protein KSP39_PZI021466 [Platanthera zijinensis]|uniref:Uncharacterized protein n=1 Tax=Platanthera zijinensis TaxID=2320716 RepID=A0AAP0AX27_9ASPA
MKRNREENQEDMNAQEINHFCFSSSTEDCYAMFYYMVVFFVIGVAGINSRLSFRAKTELYYCYFLRLCAAETGDTPLAGDQTVQVAALGEILLYPRDCCVFCLPEDV